MHTGLLLLVVTLANAVFPAAASCWERAGERHGVHPHLLAAIAKVESNLNPDAINASHESRTGSVDLGLMQINSSWLPTLARHGVTRDQLFDACTSVHVAAWILADLFARYGITWEAVGAYNAACVRIERSECARRRYAYASKVHAALHGLRGSRAAPPRAEARSPLAAQARILVVRVDAATNRDPSLPSASSTGLRAQDHADG